MAENPDELNDGIRSEKLQPEQAKELESLLRSEGLGPPQAQTAVRVFQSFSSHRGPLPPAEEFQAYEAVFPGAAKEILNMAVRQQEHFHFCEKSAIDGELTYRMFGMASAVLTVFSPGGGRDHLLDIWTDGCSVRPRRGGWIDHPGWRLHQRASTLRDGRGRNVRKAQSQEKPSEEAMTGPV